MEVAFVQRVVFFTAFSVRYIVWQLVEWIDVLESYGGPPSASTPFDLWKPLIPSLFLGSLFLVLVVSVRQPATRFFPENGEGE